MSEFMSNWVTFSLNLRIFSSFREDEAEFRSGTARLENHRPCSSLWCKQKSQGTRIVAAFPVAGTFIPDRGPGTSPVDGSGRGRELEWRTKINRVIKRRKKAQRPKSPFSGKQTYVRLRLRWTVAASRRSGCERHPAGCSGARVGRRRLLVSTMDASAEWTSTQFNT